MSESVQRKRISLEHPADLLDRLDALKEEWGLRSRGDLVVRLLETLVSTARDADPAKSDEGEPETTDFDEQGRLVLAHRSSWLISTWSCRRPGLRSTAIHRS